MDCALKTAKNLTGIGRPNSLFWTLLMRYILSTHAPLLGTYLAQITWCTFASSCTVSRLCRWFNSCPEPQALRSAKLCIVTRRTKMNDLLRFQILLLSSTPLPLPPPLPHLQSALAIMDVKNKASVIAKPPKFKFVRYSKVRLAGGAP